MDENVERQIAHLAMIQAIIARMASNSFSLKTLSVTLCAGAIALLGAMHDPSVLYVAAAIVPIVVFWWMDAKYLRLERLYRSLYDDVRKGATVDTFDMNIQRYYPLVSSVSRIALSWSVVAIYSTLLGILLMVALSVWR